MPRLTRIPSMRAVLSAISANFSVTLAWSSRCCLESVWKSSRCCLERFRTSSRIPRSPERMNAARETIAAAAAAVTPSHCASIPGSYHRDIPGAAHAKTPPRFVRAGARSSRRNGSRSLSDRAGFLFEGRVETLLPIQSASESGAQLLARVTDANRQAPLVTVTVPNRDAAPEPLPFADQLLAQVINEIVGQPCGWGGPGGYRDCSSTLLDVLLAVSLPLPRNSSQRAVAGMTVSLAGLEPAGNEARILALAAPFRTILGMLGHVMLCPGAFEGVPVAFHTIWGLRTESANGSSPGRHLIGRSVITGLSPGSELSASAPVKGDRKRGRSPATTRTKGSLVNDDISHGALVAGPGAEVSIDGLIEVSTLSPGPGNRDAGV